MPTPESALPYSNLLHLCASDMQHPALACLISAVLKQLTFRTHGTDKRAQVNRSAKMKTQLCFVMLWRTDSVAEWAEAPAVDRFFSPYDAFKRREQVADN